MASWEIVEEQNTKTNSSRRRLLLLFFLMEIDVFQALQGHSSEIEQFAFLSD